MGMNIQKATRQYEQWLTAYTPLVKADLDFKHQQMALGVFPFLRATYYRWAQVWPSVCDEIFKIERELHDCSPEERKAGRLKLSKPKLDEFRLWLDVQSVSALPQSALGKAVGYCLNQWSKLIVFLEDGRLEVDNNRAERAVKPFVIGRKNWLFANTPCGAQSSAISYSVVESAKQNGLNPLSYLTHVFSTLHTIASQDTDALDALMPWSAEMQTRFNIDKQSPA